MSQSPSLESLILGDRGISYALTDTRLNIRSVQGASAFLGRKHANPLGRSLLELIPELIGSETDLAALLAGRLPRLQLQQLQGEDTETENPRYFTLVELPHHDPVGAITGLIHIVQEVTETGRLEQRVMQQRNELRLLQEALRAQNVELLAANAELRRLDEVKSAFVSIAAHELRTPLSSIAGYLEMLLDGDAGRLTPQQTEYLRIVENSAGRLLHITRDLLDVTRIEAGRLELTLRPTDLSAVIHKTIIEQTPQFELKTQTLKLHIASKLPLAMCDPYRAAQIIGNLLSNASKYSPVNGQITVNVAQSADKPGFLAVSVADQGLGIDRADHTRLFHPFFRASAASQADVTGTGLGLYIARSLTELHGGAITFDSQPGKGSVFNITLPLADEVAPEDTEITGEESPPKRAGRLITT